jgi:hypothetical protein
MALGLTQPLTEMSTMNLPGDEGQPAHRVDNLTTICEPIVYKMWEPQRLTILWASTPCYRDSFTFFYFMFVELFIVCPLTFLPLNNIFWCIWYLGTIAGGKGPSEASDRHSVLDKKIKKEHDKYL